ncbi:MAG TPA: efflux RND transporter periplasmic adaptor subunit [Oscillatoriaceae cyanobacterium]
MSPKEARPGRARAIWIGAVLVLAVVGIVWGTITHRPAPPSFDTQPVDRGPIAAKVTATGTLSALVTVQVGSQVSGRIQALYADYNSQVHKGELLARIDPQLFDAALKQAQANAIAAQASLTKARVQYADAELQANRDIQLAKQGFVAAGDRDTAVANAATARAQVTAAEASVSQAQASLNQAQVNLAYTRILSPIDGVVISRSVDVGQTVAASFQAPVLFTLAQDLRKLQVDTSVAEADIGKLRPGMPASFQVDAYPGQEFKGTVRQVRNAATTTQNVVTYDAVIDVSNPDLRLKPGMTANVTFVVAQDAKALRVPNTALRFTPSRLHRKPMTLPPDTRLVWVLDGKRPHPVKVKTGITDGQNTQIVSGDLQEGQQVIVGEGAPGAAGGQGGQRRGGRRMFF